MSQKIESHMAKNDQKLDMPPTNFLFVLLTCTKETERIVSRANGLTKSGTTKLVTVTHMRKDEKRFY